MKKIPKPNKQGRGGHWGKARLNNSGGSLKRKRKGEKNRRLLKKLKIFSKTVAKNTIVARVQGGNYAREKGGGWGKKKNDRQAGGKK